MYSCIAAKVGLTARTLLPSPLPIRIPQEACSKIAPHKDCGFPPEAGCWEEGFVVKVGCSAGRSVGPRPMPLI